jgi:hypothetical protein
MKLRGADKARGSFWRQVDRDDLSDNRPSGGQRQDQSPIVLRVKGFID